MKTNRYYFIIFDTVAYEYHIKVKEFIMYILVEQCQHILQSNT
jgi:hypothetical protein